MQYDYCRVPLPNGRGRTESDEKLYATPDIPHYEMDHTGGKSPEEYQEYDYTAIYEDPTSASYVVCCLLAAQTMSGVCVLVSE